MCEISFIGKLKKNHELHSIAVGLLLYSQTKNIAISGGIAGVVYYYMIQVEQRNKPICSCNKGNDLKIVKKTLTNK